jgi:hypothetical protein
MQTKYMLRARGVAPCLLAPPAKPPAVASTTASSQAQLHKAHRGQECRDLFSPYPTATPSLSTGKQHHPCALAGLLLCSTAAPAPPRLRLPFLLQRCLPRAPAPSFYVPSATSPLAYSAALSPASTFGRLAPRLAPNRPPRRAANL